MEYVETILAIKREKPAGLPGTGRLDLAATALIVLLGTFVARTTPAPGATRVLRFEPGATILLGSMIHDVNEGTVETISVSHPPQETANEETVPAAKKADLEAIITGDLETVQELLSNDLSLISMIDNNRGKSSTGLTALQLAIKHGHPGIVRLLLSKGAHVDAKTGWGYGSLYVAARYGRANLVKLLVEYGADVNGRMNNFRYPPLRAVSNAQVAQALIANGADVNWRDEQSATPLHSITRQGTTTIAEVLLAHGADINAKDNAGRTPLHIAASYARKDMVEFLITKAADINAKDKRGSTPLHRAVTGDWTVPKPRRKATAQLLLARGADFTIHDVAWVGDVAKVRKLLESDPSLAENAGRALFAAIREGHSAVVELLLDNGAGLSTKGRFKEPPLHAAAYSGHRDMAALLLRKGADVNRKGAHGELALHWAAAKGHGRIARLLVEAGAEVNTHTDTPRADVDVLPAGDDADVIHEQLRFLADCEKQEQANAMGSSYQIMGLLRLAFAAGDTALHSAAQWGQKKIVELLLSNGADVNVTNKLGQTPLHYAVVFRHEDVVKTLLNAGADPNAKTLDGPTAHDLASKVKDTNLADMLGMEQNMIGPAEQVEVETTYAGGLRCSAELIKNELPFAQGPELAVSLTNTTNEPIDVIGYCRNPKVNSYRCLLPCAQFTISPVGSDLYGIGSYGGIRAKPEAIRIAPGKSWSFRMPPPKIKESTPTEDRRFALAGLLGYLLPGKYTAQVTYSIRESEIENFGPKLYFGPEMGDLSGKKPDKLWRGVITSNELVFEVLDDNSDLLSIRRAVESGEGLENVEFELRASNTKIRIGQEVALSLFVKNTTGAKTHYLGYFYRLVETSPEGRRSHYSGPQSSSLLELKPGTTLELTRWKFHSRRWPWDHGLAAPAPLVPGTYTVWVECISRRPPGRVLEKSNPVTIEVLKPTVRVERVEIDNRKDVPANRLIVPGRGVGNFTFGMSKDDVLKGLIKSKDDSLRVAANSISVDGVILNIIDDSLKSIDVLSPLYKFANGLGIGSSEQQIIQAFGNDCYLKEHEGKDFLTYKDKGLVFEIYKHKRTVMEMSVLNIADSPNQSRKTDVQLEAEEVSKLAAQLQSENRRERCQAALKLELLGDRRGVPALIKELNDTSYRPVGISPGSTSRRDDPEAKQEVWVRQDRYYAALLLGTLKDKRAVPALIEATRDKTIDYQAAMSLGQIGDKRAIPALRDMLERCSNKPFPRLFAGYGLAMLGDKEGLKVVVDTLNNHQVHWTIRRHAIGALGKLRDKEAVPYLIAALKDEHPNIRVSAAKALGAIGDRSALPALKQALEDKTETKVNAPTTVSEAAAKAIAQIEGRGSVVEAEEDCNGAVDGLQLRLRTEKLVWQSSEAPILKADVRNNGTRKKAVPMFALGYLVEIDGVSYSDQVVRSHWASDTWNAQVPLAPGEERIGVEISLDEHMKYFKGELRGALGPGKHVVRIGFPHDDLASKENQFFSNPVVIEILSPERRTDESDEVGWGEAVEGLQCRLRADEKTFKAGTLVGFKAEICHH